MFEYCRNSNHVGLDRWCHKPGRRRCSEAGWGRYIPVLPKPRNGTPGQLETTYHDQNGLACYIPRGTLRRPPVSSEKRSTTRTPRPFAPPWRLPSPRDSTDLCVSQAFQLRGLYHLFGYDSTTWSEERGISLGCPVTPVPFMDWTCDYS